MTKHVKTRLVRFWTELCCKHMPVTKREYIGDGVYNVRIECYACQKRLSPGVDFGGGPLKVA